MNSYENSLGFYISKFYNKTQENLNTLDPALVPDMVVSQRLEKVADQLSRVADDSAGVKDLEDELLKSDTPMVTPPPEVAEVIGTSVTVSTAPATDGLDQLDERVNQIFGKKRSIEDDGPATSPKVANITVTSGNGDNVDSAIASKNADDNTVNSPPDNGQNPEDNMDVDPDDDDDDDDGEGEDGEWQEPEEEPELYPEGAFPMQVPGYPMQPIFNYRYRTPNSTPRSRRIDFKNSIVVRNVTRDPHTGRVSQEDYEIREDSEMALSLG